MMKYTYEADEINKFLYADDDEFPVQLKVQSDQGSSKWLNVSREQLTKIFEVFLETGD